MAVYTTGSASMEKRSVTPYSIASGTARSMPSPEVWNSNADPSSYEPRCRKRALSVSRAWARHGVAGQVPRPIVTSRVATGPSVFMAPPDRQDESASALRRTSAHEHNPSCPARVSSCSHPSQRLLNGSAPLRPPARGFPGRPGGQVKLEAGPAERGGRDTHLAVVRPRDAAQDRQAEPRILLARAR